MGTTHILFSFLLGTLDKPYIWGAIGNVLREQLGNLKNPLKTWWEADENLTGTWWEFFLFFSYSGKLGFLSILLIWQNFGFLWSFTAKIGYLGKLGFWHFWGFLGSYRKIKCHGRLGWYIAFDRTISIKYKPYLLD